jgi:sulfite exporter TauE/SafE
VTFLEEGEDRTGNNTKTLDSIHQKNFIFGDLCLSCRTEACFICETSFRSGVTVDYALPLLAGVLGSFHCVGMCGAIVVAYAIRSGATPGGKLPASALSTVPMHLTYNAGRLFSYTVVGALAGLLGGVIGTVHAAGVWFSLLAGGLMVVTGILMLDLVPGIRIWEGGEATWIRRLHLRSLANLLSLATLESKFYIGILTPLLPCGLLYSMFLKAAATGTPLDGALTMLLFGAGIVPSLLVTGLLSSYAGIRIRRYAATIAAVTIIVMGVTIVLRGAGIPLPFMGGMHGHHSMDAPPHPTP